MNKLTIDAACFERGCACHDSRIDGDGVVVRKVEPATLTFPTMLRKMWSGSEVQSWIDKQGDLYREAK